MPDLDWSGRSKESEGCGKKRSWPGLSSVMYVEGLNKTTTVRVNRVLGRYLPVASTCNKRHWRSKRAWALYERYELYPTFRLLLCSSLHVTNLLTFLGTFAMSLKRLLPPCLSVCISWWNNSPSCRRISLEFITLGWGGGVIKFVNQSTIC